MRDITVLFISDSTAITAEKLGTSLLKQFDEIKIWPITIPFVDSMEKVHKAVEQINQIYTAQNTPPLVFCTLINPEFANILKQSNCQFFDLINTFLPQLEQSLALKAKQNIGKTHGIEDKSKYDHRISAIDFSLKADDGLASESYKEADIILVGVSRSGKTPTSIYLSIQYGLKVANYPLIEQDLDNYYLPQILRSHKNKLFGLSIDPEKLHKIRSHRRPGSRYASLTQCQQEVFMAENLFYNENIPFLKTSNTSIEEISSVIINSLRNKQKSPPV